MSEHQAPLVPADCDLTDFPFLPLMVQRLRSSKAWLKCKRRPELAFYLVNLWTAAWHERPAASLEDDDDMLADKAMCPPERWDELKAEILRGWVRCSDGRLYHPVVAERALEAWDGKLRQRWRNYCAALKKSCQRRVEEFLPPEFEEWVAQGCPHRVPGTTLKCPRDNTQMSPGQMKDAEGQGADGFENGGDNQSGDAECPDENGSKERGRGRGRGKEIGTGTENNTPPPPGAVGASNVVRLRPITADSDRAIPMTLDWRPTEDIRSRMQIQGVLPSRLTDDAISEFAGYWHARKGMATQGEWEHKLVQRLKTMTVDRARPRTGNGNTEHHGDVIETM